MNYIDIGALALVGLGLVFGLFGRGTKKIIHMVCDIVAVVAAYLVFDKVWAYVAALDMSTIIPDVEAGTTFQAWVLSFIEPTLSGMGIDASALGPIIGGIAQVLVFWVVAIALLIVMWIVGLILGAIFHGKKHTAILTLGIPGAVRAAIFWAVFLFPVFVLSPILKSATAIADLSEDLEPAKETLGTVEEQAKGSKLLEFTDKFFAKGEFKVVIYTTEVEDGGAVTTQEQNVFNDLKTVPSLLKMASMFTATDTENPMEALEQMSDDDIREMLANIENCPAIKEVVASVAESILPEGVEIDFGSVDLSQEADAIIAVKDVMSKDLNELSNEDVTNLIDNVADSALVQTVAEAQPGLLADLPAEQKADIQNQLSDKVDNGDITPEQMESLMKLFEAQGE